MKLNLWYLALEDDDYVDVYDCKAVHGLAKSLSLGYHWRMVDHDSMPVVAGLRLGVEDADMHGKASAGLPRS